MLKIEFLVTFWLSTLQPSSSSVLKTRKCPVIESGLSLNSWNFGGYWYVQQRNMDPFTRDESWGAFEDTCSRMSVRFKTYFESDFSVQLKVFNDTNIETTLTYQFKSQQTTSEQQQTTTTTTSRYSLTNKHNNGFQSVPITMTPVFNNGETSVLYFCQETESYSVIEHAWILSRNKQTSNHQIAQIVDQIRNLGIGTNLENLEKRLCPSFTPKLPSHDHYSTAGGSSGLKRLRLSRKSLVYDEKRLTPEQIRFLRCVQDLEARGLHKFLNICFDRMM